MCFTRVRGKFASAHALRAGRDHKDSDYDIQRWGADANGRLNVHHIFDPKTIHYHSGPGSYYDTDSG